MNRTLALQPPRLSGALVSDTAGALRRVVAAVVVWALRRLDRTPPPAKDLYVATYTVLLELLHADAGPTREQRRHLEAALRGQLGLRPRAGCALLRAAERTRASQGILASVRLVAESYTTPQKVQLVRIMHGLVNLDGVVTRRERYLLRKLGSLLRVDASRVDEIEWGSHTRVG